MTADVPERPLIPQPPTTVTHLRRAVAKIMPASLPEFASQLDDAVDEAVDPAQQRAEFGPLWRFTTRWAVYVWIQRQPRVAARFQELEDLAVTLDDREQIRAATSELGRILDDAHEAIGYGRR
ncbi:MULTISPECIES: hypothetical protein [Streptomyces]|uniref:Uncharacterized protein n=2 Tax=Streptomyces TaxID=1883 RepID=A0A939FJL6_9ACTN|nr:MULTISPECIES: hypothetical protein [Streptomyces]MBO0651966.1 hypothetical protein [Streptomyces triculaminicus]QSY47124.1 hypothetical protein J3S04_17210 [Streptomyces griseocarneus]